jgi:nucleotide-binding universal stress UspA family protein
VTQGDPCEKDLVVLVADNNMESAFQGIFARWRSLSTRQVTADVLVHPLRDAGCRREAPEFLRSQSRRYRHALIVFDREGCGSTETAAELEAAVQRRLAAAGWAERAACVVIDPELEAWVWSTSPHVESVLGWRGRQPDLRTWLTERGFFPSQGHEVKPSRPKEALVDALREVKKIRSSAIYSELASSVGLAACTDTAFVRLRTILQKWFPATPEGSTDCCGQDKAPGNSGQ